MESRDSDFSNLKSNWACYIGRHGDPGYVCMVCTQGTLVEEIDTDGAINADSLYVSYQLSHFCYNNDII